MQGRGTHFVFGAYCVFRRASGKPGHPPRRVNRAHVQIFRFANCAEERPRGLKPQIISKTLRGAEAPLFHGIAYSHGSAYAHGSAYIVEFFRSPLGSLD